MEQISVKEQRETFTEKMLGNISLLASAVWETIYPMLCKTNILSPPSD